MSWIELSAFLSLEFDGSAEGSVNLLAWRGRSTCLLAYCLHLTLVMTTSLSRLAYHGAM